jgi:hypothetical protein
MLFVAARIVQTKMLDVCRSGIWRIAIGWFALEAKRSVLAAEKDRRSCAIGPDRQWLNGRLDEEFGSGAAGGTDVAYNALQRFQWKCHLESPFPSN